MRIGNVLDFASSTLAPEKATRSLPVRAVIVFEHVTFGCEPVRPVLRDLSPTLRPGERVAFVGHSVAGKTTSTQLLLRLTLTREMPA